VKIILEIVSKPFGYIAIFFFSYSSLVLSFYMDILEYAFGIHPTKHKLQRIRREKENIDR